MIKKILLWSVVGIVFLNLVLALLYYNLFDFTPIGYRFELLKDTPVWDLAKAVKNEDVNKIKELIKERHLDVNYQERKSEWGVTLLHLSVGNGKVKAVKALLDNGARLDIRDSLGFYPLNHVCSMTFKINHRLEILKMLLEYGANPNAVAKLYYKGDTIPMQIRTPIGDAVKDLACTKILLEHGADLYYQIKPSPNDDSQISYINWVGLLGLQDDPEYTESIFVAKYLIVDKQMPIPDPLEYLPNDTGYHPVSALYFLNKVKYFFPSKNKARDEILAYLKKEGFPNHGVVRNGKVIR